MGRIKWGGIEIREKEAFTLPYADDIMLMAEEKDKIRSMVGKLEEKKTGNKCKKD